MFGFFQELSSLALFLVHLLLLLLLLQIFGLSIIDTYRPSRLSPLYNTYFDLQTSQKQKISFQGCSIHFHKSMLNLLVPKVPIRR